MRLEGYKLYHHNGLYLGEVMMDMDGFYKFWPDKGICTGYWDERVLLELAQLLQNKNAEWHKNIEEWFSKHDNTPSDS